jgi:hypothetical protein
MGWGVGQSTTRRLGQGRALRRPAATVQLTGCRYRCGRLARPGGLAARPGAGATVRLPPATACPRSIRSAGGSRKVSCPDCLACAQRPYGKVPLLVRSRGGVYDIRTSCNRYRIDRRRSSKRSRCATAGDPGRQHPAGQPDGAAAAAAVTPNFQYCLHLRRRTGGRIRADVLVASIAACRKCCQIKGKFDVGPCIALPNRTKMPSVREAVLA